MTDPESPWSREREPRATRRTSVVSGALLAMIPVPVLVVARVHGFGLDEPWWRVGAALSLALSIALAGLLLRYYPFFGRLLATLAAIGSLVLGSAYLAQTPLVTLTTLVGVTTALAWIWTEESSFHARQSRNVGRSDARLRGAASAALGLWLITSLSDGVRSSLDALGIGFCFLTVSALAIDWCLRADRPRRKRVMLLGAVGAVPLLSVLLLRGRPWLIASLEGLVAATAMLVSRDNHSFGEEGESWWEPILARPERAFVATFAALIAVGTLLLALPLSSGTQTEISFLDAMFTAVSAVCVTGLAVLDTPVDFSTFGQVGILILIQLGGLGIMTFSTVVLWALGRRMSMRHEGTAASLLSKGDHGRLAVAARGIVVLTLTVELFGAGLLCAAFNLAGDGFATAAWRAIFTAVSAFCNAGFALQSTSLVPYQSNPFVLHVVSALIVLGSLSPATILAAPGLLQPTSAAIPLQAKLSFVATGALLLAGFVSILAFEWSGALASLSIADRLHNAWFQSVTLRTAGFNSVELGSLRSTTVSIMLLWMFIGGSPGGTAGGIKTTTAAVLLLSMVGAVRGRWTVEAFGRRISDRVRHEAAVVVTVAVCATILAILSIELTQSIPSDVAIFEVVSALATVGLSLGGTAQLDGIGKIVIAACMFVGRVGGLTLLVFFSQSSGPNRATLPSEDVDVG